MATRERDELRQLVDELSDEQVEAAVAVMRQFADVGKSPRARRPSWTGAIHESPDLSVRVKDILRDELGTGQRG